MTIETVKKIAKAIDRKGGQTYYVGGYVRDKLLGVESKDIDIEVHGLSLEELEEVLEDFGQVQIVGKSFGILIVKNLDVDFSVPKKVVDGEQVIQVDMGIAESMRRRDFTVNAIMQNVLTGEYSDLYGGLTDLKKGVLKAVTENTFKEDPLRVYRLAQFSSRLNFEIDEKTVELAKQADLTDLSIERVNEEFRKGLTKSKKPSKFIKALNKLEVLEKEFEEIYKLIGCEQNEEYHPEGDVYNHTLMVLDEASKFLAEVERPYEFMLSALYHDVGKPASVEVREGKLTTYGHDEIGAEMVKLILPKKLTNNKETIKYVSTLTKNHMRPRWLYPKASKKSFRKLANEGYIEDLFKLVEADSMGRGNATKEEYKVYKDFFAERMESLKLKEELKPIVTGKDLIEQGLKPSKQFSRLKEQAYNLQLEGYTKEQILKTIL